MERTEYTGSVLHPLLGDVRASAGSQLPTRNSFPLTDVLSPQTHQLRVVWSTEPAGRRESWFVGGAVLVSVMFFFALVPFAKSPLSHIPSFIPAYESALVICDLITAVLLFVQFNVLRSPAMLLLACGYIFTASIALVHALTFPEVFSPGGLLGAGPQTTGWLYLFWHVGFPLFVILYAVLKEDQRAARQEEDSIGLAHRQTGYAIACGIAVVVAIVGAFALLTTLGQGLLPVLLVAGRFTVLLTLGVSVGAISCVAALALLWWRRPHTVLDLWLMVVMCAWLCDLGLSAVFNASRFDVGWYFGRTYGLVAASALLILLLVETGRNYARLSHISFALRKANKSLEELSLHDSLTLLANRRFFDAYLDQQIAVARRHKRMLALVLCDVDAFKRYNDDHGHQAGDECLTQVAAALESCCRRPADLAARYGGEEFALILPDTDLAGAVVIAEAARSAVGALRFPHAQSAEASRVNISGGVAVLLPTFDRSAEQLIAAADACLFEAKRLGRNQIVSGGERHYEEERAGPAKSFA